MRITEIEITNLRAIANLRVEFRGSLLVVKGENGVGKTSLLKGLASIFEGGHDPTLIRTGQKKAEVFLALDSGTTIRKVTTLKGTTLEIKTADGTVVKSPQSYLRELASGFAFDPIKFVDASAKDRIAFLQKAMNLEFEVAEVVAAIERPFDFKGDVMSLDDLAALRKKLYERRTVVNGSVESMNGHLKELRLALPADEDQDWGAVQAALEATLAEKQAELDDALVQCKDVKDGVVESYRKIRDNEIAAANRKYEECSAAAERSLLVAMEEARTELGPTILHLNQEIGSTKAKAEAQAQAAGTKKAIEQTKQKCFNLQSEASDLSNALTAIDALKVQKLEESPIPGIEIRDGEIFYKGLPFDAVNLAEKYKLSIKIASLKMGDLPVMIADDAEHLSRENWEALCAAVQASDLQLVIARVESDAELTVESAA